MIYTAFDPGGTTGWARYVSVGGGKFSCGQFPQSISVETLILHSDIVICEKLFVGSLDFNPVGFKVCGVIEYFAAKQRHINLVYQPPSSMKAVVAWDIVDTSQFKTEHPKDALYHLLFYLVKQKVLTLALHTHIEVDIQTP